MSASLTSLLGTGSTSAGTGIDVTAVVNQILDSRRGPEKLWQAQEAALTSETSAWSTIRTNLATLSDKMFDLTNVLGPIASKIASSSDPSTVTATAQSTAASGIHLLTVDHLATTASAYTDPVTPGTLTGGKVSVQVGTGTVQEVTVDPTSSTLDAVASAINAKQIGVIASVVTDATGQRLALVSQSTGEPGNLTISSTVPELNFTTNRAKNASFTLDGVPLAIAGNSTSTLIPGVTLNLLGSTGGSEVQLTVGPDVSAAKQAVTDFVGAYNTLITGINEQYSVDPSTVTAGPLAGDGSLRLVQSALLSDMSYSLAGSSGILALSSLGVSTNNDGTLSVDDATLTSVVTNQFSDFQSFFQSLDTENPGFATRFNTDLNSLLDPIAGPVALDLLGISNTQQDLSRQIQDLEDRLASQEVQLINQYSQVNAALQQLPLLQQQISSQLAGLSG